MLLEENLKIVQQPRLEVVRNEPYVVSLDSIDRLRWYFALEFARDCDVCYLLEFFKF